MRAFQYGAAAANLRRWIFAMQCDLAARMERAYADLHDAEPPMAEVLRRKLAAYADLMATLEKHEQVAARRVVAPKLEEVA